MEIANVPVGSDRRLRMLACVQISCILMFCLIGFSKALCATPVSAQGVFDVTNFGADASAATDSCLALKRAAGALQANGGGVLKFPPGQYVSGCAVAIMNAPVQIEGGGLGATSLSFTSKVDFGFLVREDSAFRRVGVRDINLVAAFRGADEERGAIRVEMPNVNSPDISVLIQNLQIGNAGRSENYFPLGIDCLNCGHFIIAGADIQGRSISKAMLVVDNMSACIRIRGYSSSGKLASIECSASKRGVWISGDSEGMNITGINTVGVNDGILFDDDASGDKTSAPYRPAGEIEQFFCDGFVSCLTTKAWNQMNVHDFSFYKRMGSQAQWSGINFIDGHYSEKTFGTLHSKISMGRCAANDGGNGALCVTLSSRSNYNTISDVDVDGMSYFVDEGWVSKGNRIHDNNGFVENSEFYPNQKSIYRAWRFRPSPFNSNRFNAPAVMGDDKPYNLLAENSATPNVGGFNLKLFHTMNTRSTTISDFANGAPGDVIDVVAGDDKTMILHGRNIATKGGSNVKLSLGSMVTFVNDGGLWRQR